VSDINATAEAIARLAEAFPAPTDNHSMTLLETVNAWVTWHNNTAPRLPTEALDRVTHLMVVVGDAVRNLDAYIAEMLDPDRAKCESPIEISFLAAIRAHPDLAGFKPQIPTKNNKYRIDFGDPTTKIGVELDGYEYHSTKEQFVADRKRQRALEMEGWRIIRFSGSEVHADAADCALQLIGWLKAVAPATPRPAPIDPSTGRAALGGRARLHAKATT